MAKLEDARHPSRLEHAIDLLRILISRDLKVRYKRSRLGFAWSLMNPLAQLLIFTFLFRMVLPLNIPHYPSYVFIGVLAYSWFSGTLISAGGSIVNNPELVRRPGFPIAMLPVLTVASNGIHFLLALPVLLAFAAIDGVPLGTCLILLPGLIALQFFLLLSLSYLISAANVHFRDVEHLVGIGVMLGFYLTPVFYSADALPATYRVIYELNPMASLLGAYRAVIVEDQLPNLTSLVYLSVISLLLFVAGGVLYRRTSATFVEQI